MLYAQQSQAVRHRITAVPGSKGVCPVCKSPVIAKCGEIKVWHWAHESLRDCDEWYEPESQWHIQWKNEFPEEWREVVMKNHRADIRAIARVIELQHSPIDPATISAREAFYQSLVWVFDVSKSAKNISLTMGPCDLIELTWKHPRKSIFFATKVVYLDMGNNTLFHLLRWKNGTEVRGCQDLFLPAIAGIGLGYQISRAAFVKKYSSIL